MRIISGKYRGRRLKSPPSLQTRPTSDRLRETLFDILAPRIAETRFLDLCAGSGAVGIEALSRGAAHATFVDQSRKMAGLIESNLTLLKIEDADFELVLSEALEFLHRRAKNGTEPFDTIFFDPPYKVDYHRILGYLGEDSGRLLRKDGLLVVEHDKRNELRDEFAALKRYRIVRQGDSCL